MTFTKPIARVERIGTTLTKVTTVSANDTWSHDESASLFTIKLASAPSATNVIIVYYYLFYSTGVTRYTYEDPSDNTTTLRTWLPRIVSAPDISQSFGNTINGVLTQAPTHIDLINDNHEFENYLTINDSFANKAIDIWICLNSTSNVRRIYSGRTQSIRLNTNRVSIDASDPFALLNKPCHFGINPIGYLTVYGSDTVYQQDVGKPLHIFFGKTSYYKTTGRAISNGLSLSDLVDGLPCYPYNVSATISTTTNINWYMGAQISGGCQFQTYGTITRTTTNGSYRYIMFSSLQYVAVGHSITWTEAAVQYGAVVYYVGDFTYLGNAYNVVISSTDPFTTGSTMDTSQRAIAVGLKDYPSVGTVTVLKHGIDYQFNQGTAGGLSTAVSTMNISGLGIIVLLGTTTVNPGTHKMFYKFEHFTSDGSMTQAQVLKGLLQFAGLSTDTASFAAVDAALPDRVNFTIPNIDETEHKTYLKYVTDILASTYGYLSINSSGNVEYHLLAAPSSTDSRDESSILRGSFSTQINYQDIATSLKFQNPHLPSTATSIAEPSESSSKAKYLHGTQNSKSYRHCLELNGSNELTRQDQIFAVLSQRSVKYRWQTSTLDIDVALGDDIQLDHDGVLGGSGSGDVKVTGLTLSDKGISVEAQDLKDL